MASHRSLAPLRVLLITDGSGDPRRIERLVTAAIHGGVRAVQLREPNLTARELGRLCAQLWPIVDDLGGVLLVNDRLDVAAAGLAHGAQVGHRSLAPALARAVLGPTRWLGASVHAAGELAGVAAAGADFALLAPVWPTAAKPGQPALGLELAAAWTAAAPLPVLWLGGVGAGLAGSVAALPPSARPAGVAVCSAICAARDVEAAAGELIAAFGPVLANPGEHA